MENLGFPGGPGGAAGGGGGASHPGVGGSQWSRDVAAGVDAEVARRMTQRQEAADEEDAPTEPAARRRGRRGGARGGRGRGSKRARAEPQAQAENDEEDDGEDESGTRKNWSPKETLTLVRLKKEQEQLFNRDKMAALTSGNSTKRWAELAKELAKESGVTREGSQVSGKWDRTILGYREIKDYHGKTTGGGPSYWLMSPEERRACVSKLPASYRIEVFDAIDEWMSDRAVIRPRGLYASSTRASSSSNSGQRQAPPETDLPDLEPPPEPGLTSAETQPAPNPAQTQPAANAGAANQDGDSVTGSTGKKKGKKKKDTVGDALSSSSDVLAKEMRMNRDIRREQFDRQFNRQMEQFDKQVEIAQKTADATLLLAQGFAKLGDVFGQLMQARAAPPPPPAPGSAAADEEDEDDD